MLHLARRHRVGPADPRLPRGARRRRRPDGLGVPAPRHEPRRPPRLPRGDQRRSSAGARSWASPGGCTATSGCSARPPTGWSRRSCTRPAARPRTASRSPTSRRPTSSTRPRSRRPRSCRSSPTRRSRELEEELADELGPWQILPESNPAFGEAKATVDEHFVEFPDEELGLEGAADYVTVYSFETGGKEDLPDDPSRWDRITHKVKSTADRSSTHRATPSSRCSRSSSRRP